MNRIALLVAPLVILCTAVPVWAQARINPDGWEQQDGLTVASAQVLTAEPTKLRLFTNLTVRDKDARQAVRGLAEKKKLVKEKLLSLGMKPSEVEFSLTRILQWDNRENSWLVWNAASRPLRVPLEQPKQFTAYAAVQVEWDIKDKTDDELTLMQIDLIEKVREAAVFGPRKNQAQETPNELDHEIYMIFVGEISEEAQTAASKRAYEEAAAEARKLSATTNVTLGKLETMAPSIDGSWSWYWDYRYSLKYEIINRTDSQLPHPMSQFSHAPCEVFNADPSELQRTYSMELRFELK